MRKQWIAWLSLIVGSGLLVFLGWRWNVPLAAWLAPVFLIHFFRDQKRWPFTLVAVPLMTLGLFANLTGSWDFAWPVEIGISLLRAVPFLIGLYLDRWLARRLRPVVAMLVYPASYVVVDYVVGLTPLGTVFSTAVTQFEMSSFLQLTSVTGIWGLAFVMGWFASVVNLAWDQGFDLRRVGLPVGLLAIALSGILILGGLRLALEPSAPTVRVAGVTVEQVRDYWGECIDQDTPREKAHRYEAELSALEDQLFEESRRAAEAGAQIILWSEANAIVYPENAQAFLDRAQAFARQHHVYLAPAYIILRYGETTADNKVAMIAPDGEIAYTYTKTMSWYPTDSDGLLRAIDTPYGRVSTAICFDMDFPALLHQAARQDVDIMLVPAFDWEPIKPFHTQVGLFRGVENGFSVMRQTNEGTSMAIDYQGRVLAYQDFYATSGRIMMADIPTRGAKTLYGRLGDWFAYLNMILLPALILIGVRGQLHGARTGP